MKYFLPFFFSFLILTFLFLPEPSEADMARIHIVANSDEERDVEIKLKVADRVSALLSSESFEDTESIKNGLEARKEEIRALSDTVLAENGVSYKTHVDVGLQSFGKKTLGNSVFPEGEYLALVVTLGEGRGHNWWSVIFPDVSLEASLALGEEGGNGKIVLINGNKLVKIKSIILELLTKVKKSSKISVS